MSRLHTIRRKMNEKLERIWKEEIVAYMKYHLAIFLQKLE
jgi:hypothetical protein